MKKLIMSKLVVSVITVLSIIGFSGCGAKYQTIPMGTALDTAKVRTVYETNVSTTEDVRAYSFDLEYVDHRSIEERKKGIYFNDTTIGKILGGQNGNNPAGSKLLLKLTITQISEPFRPMKYRVGTSQYDKDERGNGHFNLITVKPGEPIVVISNIGAHEVCCGGGIAYDDSKKYDNLFTAIWTTFGGTTYDDSDKPAWHKSIAYARLEKGDYHIKLEVLETSPEFEKIRTNFLITFAYFGK